jgi:hypothetical protein
MQAIRFCVLSVLMFVLITNAGRCDTVLSRSLPGIGNRYISVRIPKGWVVKDLDVAAWSHHLWSGDFNIQKANTKKIVSIEVGNDSLDINRGFGLMRGSHFVTRSGLNGVVSTSHYQAHRTVWCLIIPVKKSEGVGIISIEIQRNVSYSDGDSAQRILRRITFVSSKTKPGFHSTN